MQGGFEKQLQEFNTLEANQNIQIQFGINRSMGRQKPMNSTTRYQMGGYGRVVSQVEKSNDPI